MKKMHDLLNLKIKLDIMLQTNFFINLENDTTFKEYISSPFNPNDISAYLKKLSTIIAGLKKLT